MKKSQKLFNHAQLTIPGGVNSPVRAFKSVGGTPLFFQRGKGAHLRAMVDDLHARTIGIEPDLTLILDIDPDTALAKGTGLVLIIAGTLSMAFMGFAGLL